MLAANLPKVAPYQRSTSGDTSGEKSSPVPADINQRTYQRTARGEMPEGSKSSPAPGESTGGITPGESPGESHRGNPPGELSLPSGGPLAN